VVRWIQIPVWHPTQVTFSLTRQPFLPSLLLRTTGLIDFKTFYSNSSLCSPHIISTFLEFLLLLMTCFGKTFLHFLIFLKFFLHITFCCLSSLLLQEWWLITELGFLFMSIFHFSIISGGEKLSIFLLFLHWQGPHLSTAFADDILHMTYPIILFMNWAFILGKTEEKKPCQSAN